MISAMTIMPLPIKRTFDKDGQGGGSAANNSQKSVDKSKKSGKIKKEKNKPTPAEQLSAQGENKFIVRGFKNKQALNNHWQNGRTHQEQYKKDGITTSEQYVNRALELLESKCDNKNIYGYKTSQGKLCRYDITKNDYATGNPTSGIYTLFKPDLEFSYFSERLSAEGISEDD